ELKVAYLVAFYPYNSSLVRYSTDAMLQKEMMTNPLLSNYGIIIVDDVYERSVTTDILLGLLKHVLLLRPELKLIVIASVEISSKLQAYYSSVPLISVKSKYQMEVVYTCNVQKDHFLSALKLLFEIHNSKESGDIVIFLACEQEIGKAYQIIQEKQSNLNPDVGELVPLPLYPSERERIFKPNEEKPCKYYKRKVLLTTSFGESLVWFKTIAFVIDTGIEKKKVYNPRIRADTVVVRPISKSQAEMRKQILGMSSGKCFCLYPEEFTDKEMKLLPQAKIQESNLTKMVLFLKRMDIAGLGHCDFIDRPAPENLMQALEDLDYLAALDNDGNLSEFGIIMSAFPVDPQLSKAILASLEFDCVEEMLTIAAMVTDYEIEKWCQNYFLNCYALRMAEAIRAELHDIMRQIELPVSASALGLKENVPKIKKALLSGYFMQTARDVDGCGNYLMLSHRHVAQLHPLSVYFNTKSIPEWVIFHKFSIAENNSIKIVSEISPDLFVELVPQFYFSNLPTSESKAILQEVINHLSPISTDKEQKTNSKDKHYEKYPEIPTEQQCIIQ
ncbi:putative pre-mRNA-splicing factor ATP-dependent RNA helicase DHX32, partial [Varanus komodoensis]